MNIDLSKAEGSVRLLKYQNRLIFINALQYFELFNLDFDKNGAVAETTFLMFIMGYGHKFDS